MRKEKQMTELAKALSWNTPKREQYRVTSETGRRARSFVIVLSGLILLIALAGLAREFFVFSNN